MRYLVVLLFIAITLSACSKKEEKNPLGSDSVFSKPVTENIPESQPKIDSASGLLVDQSRFYSPEQQALLNRFVPGQVVSIYHDFKPLRKSGITQTQINTFLQARKITLEELKAILEEGDKRGWNKK